MDKKFEKKTEFGLFRVCLDEFFEHYKRTSNGFSFNNSTVGEMAQEILDSHAEIDRLNAELASLHSKAQEEDIRWYIKQVNDSADVYLHEYQEGCFQKWTSSSKGALLLSRKDAEYVASRMPYYEIELVRVDSEADFPKTAEREWINSETHPVFKEDGIYFFVNREDGFWSADRKQANEPLAHLYDYLLLFSAKDRPKPPEPEPIEVKVGKYQYENGAMVEVVAIKESLGKQWCIFVRTDDLHRPCTLSVEQTQDLLTKYNATFIEEAADE